MLILWISGCRSGLPMSGMNFLKFEEVCAGYKVFMALNPMMQNASLARYCKHEHALIVDTVKL